MGDEGLVSGRGLKKALMPLLSGGLDMAVELEVDVCFNCVNFRASSHGLRDVFAVMVMVKA